MLLFIFNRFYESDVTCICNKLLLLNILLRFVLLLMIRTVSVFNHLIYEGVIWGFITSQLKNGIWVKDSEGNHESVQFGSHFKERINDTDCQDWKFWCGLHLITTVRNFTDSKQTEAAEILKKYNLVHICIFEISHHFLLGEKILKFPRVRTEVSVTEHWLVCRVPCFET